MIYHKLRKVLFLGLAGLLPLLYAGCQARPGDVVVDLPRVSKFSGEGFVTVQHILIKLDHDTRSQSESKQFAEELFPKAKAVNAEEFDRLVKKHGEDVYPATYTMADHKVKFDRSSHVQARSAMVPGFGNVSFGLEVGETGLLPYDFNDSKHGWHIIRRLK